MVSVYHLFCVLAIIVLLTETELCLSTPAHRSTEHPCANNEVTERQTETGGFLSTTCSPIDHQKTESDYVKDLIISVGHLKKLTKDELENLKANMTSDHHAINLAGLKQCLPSPHPFVISHHITQAQRRAIYGQLDGNLVEMARFIKQLMNDISNRRTMYDDAYVQQLVVNEFYQNIYNLLTSLRCTFQRLTKPRIEINDENSNETPIVSKSSIQRCCRSWRCHGKYHCEKREFIVMERLHTILGVTLSTMTKFMGK